MSLLENYRKFLIYLNPKNVYWRRITHGDWKVHSKLGPFFNMHLKDRLIENHYDKFDNKGLPIRIINGEKTYNYTTICSYALANWELYLETGEKKFTQPLWKALDFLRKENKVTDYGGIVFPSGELLSAMNQGEALSVVARCFELNKDEALKVFAAKIIKAYQIPISEGGVLGKFRELNEVYWYEETAEVPEKHILNGMCYALIGLFDIYAVFPDLHIANDLFNQGVQYLKKALPLFDQGNWSRYWVNERGSHYIASMMYHNLHIVQLQQLYIITQEEILNEYTNRFIEYQNSFLGRIGAGLKLINGKINF